MKKLFLIIVVCCLNFRVYSDGNQDSAYAIADALVDQIQSYNDLSESDFYLLWNVTHSELSGEDKMEALEEGSPEIQAMLAVTQSTVSLLVNYNAYAFITRNPLNLALVSSQFDWRLLGGAPNNPCGSWNAARELCDASYLECATLGAIGCGLTAAGYIPCAIAVFGVCTNTYLSCGNLADANYPGCAHSNANGGGGGPLPIRIYLYSWNELENPYTP
jgi:hypothetical protein